MHDRIYINNVKSLIEGGNEKPQLCIFEFERIVLAAMPGSLPVWLLNSGARPENVFSSASVARRLILGAKNVDGALT